MNNKTCKFCPCFNILNCNRCVNPEENDNWDYKCKSDRRNQCMCISRCMKCNNLIKDKDGNYEKIFLPFKENFKKLRCDDCYTGDNND